MFDHLIVIAWEAGAMRFRCKCERGWVRCWRIVARRGMLCEECVTLHHVDGYHDNDSVDPDVHPNRGFSRSEYAIHDRKNHAEWRKNHERKYNLVARHNGAGKVG